ncbi:MAG: RagB/SusD family nutrient uptake outer membrane protein [Tannerella sp.]|nr:RagB/SusD family nutrient uptake outer membrane protein [Tannerella sp.]
MCLICCVSCNYLDVVPDNVATIDYAFRNRTACEKYLFTCYSYLPAHGDINGDPAMTGGDEIWTNRQHLQISVDARQLALGQQSMTDPTLNFWEGRKSAKNLWQGIRDCNIFLENVDKVHDLPEYEKVRWIAEVKFLKAYYHFYLFRMYGPIPIVDVNIPIGASPDEVKFYREPVDAVVKYIIDLIDEAEKTLPLEREVIEGTEAGRINNLIAKAMRAKVLVYAASRLFNGNTDYIGMIDNRGVQLFPKDEDPEKWKLAADACLEAIEMCHAQNKRLYDLVDPQINTANDTFKLQTIYRQAICDRWNSELIWGSVNYNCSGLSRNASARLVTFASGRVAVITSDWSPSMKLVERYYSSHGVPINEDKEWLDKGWYEDRYKVRPEPSSGAEKYLVKEGQKTAYLHYNREVRFYASIGFDRGIYFGSGYYKFPDDVKHCEVFYSEYSGMRGPDYYSVTGYFAKKMHSYKNSQTSSTDVVEYYPFPIIRLADLYLLYAEALNEYSGPSEEVFKYIDAVRARVQLEGVRESWEKYSTNPQKPNNKETLREIIHQERTIELAMEGERFWDIRRWKKISELNEQPRGWNSSGETAEDFYKVITVTETPVEFSIKDYLWPIRESEMSRNTNLIQNYGW